MIIDSGSDFCDMTIEEDENLEPMSARPKDMTYEPDAELCENCAEMFRSL